ncbi:MULTISPECIES: MFS transporter [Morganella]|uniref:MFS transporter n=2 Tax=Morganella morganii TaxID=582 RepID=A0A9Q4CNS4_MORMO|nr:MULTISPECIES: MFS transporter [Morganella]BEP20951.1 MFS transporter [Morganella morganii subsp. sibonii]HDS6844142.1 MFS transporter [Morganella morganii subsp. morganii]EGT3624035.1 MFS transporter [Morganella morganii]EGT3630672.1 MFS transporter [Morganella morganii]EGT3636125.1 MFS transporter [Morganella morganii]
MSEVTAVSAAAVPAGREQMATRALFFVAGFASAAWAALVPFAKLNTGVNDGVLGLLLLCLGGGALVAMPLTGVLTTRFGCRKVMTVSVVLLSVTLPLLAEINHTGLLALTLIVFGMGIGITDCAMNIQAIIVEKAAPRPMMSGFHGFYSIGGIAGAGAMSGFMLAGMGALQAAAAVMVICLLLLAFSYKGMLDYAWPSEGPAFAVPRGAVLLIGIICFATFLAEGSVLDWSAVFLTEYRNVPESMGGLGFACFAVLMSLGRLTGDKIVAVLGRPQVVLWGALLAAGGLLLSVLSDNWLMALTGYGLIGLGCANVVPVMFSAIGRQTSMPQAVAVPAVTTLGYLGILAGPASVGLIAYRFTLPAALLAVVALLLLVALLSRKVRM